MNIWIAAADNNLAKVKEFLETESPNAADQNGYTPLHAAAEYAHLDLLKYLCEHGGDVNARDNDGDTPLHACEQVSAAELLVELGADLKAKNSDGLTPLEKAEEDADFPELVDFLRRKCGIEESLPTTAAAAAELPENMHLSVRQVDAPEQQITEEQRQRLAEIIQNGTDEDFEKYVQETLGPQETQAEEMVGKRRRKDN